MGYIYRFDNVPSTFSINGAMANALLASYLANIRAAGGITQAGNQVWLVVSTPMTASELSAWKTVLGSTYTLLGNYSGYFKDGPVEFIAL